MRCTEAPEEDSAVSPTAGARQLESEAESSSLHPGQTHMFSHWIQGPLPAEFRAVKRKKKIMIQYVNERWPTLSNTLGEKSVNEC